MIGETGLVGLAGLRVVRGKDWEGKASDGGEGHVGTVAEVLCNQTVRVIWDIGEETTCRAGTDGKCDLIILDSAQAGVRHPGSKCAECGECDFYGIRWQCQDCAGCDLCPSCYSDDKHDLRHRFLRFDHYKSDGVEVKKRKMSVRMRAMGTFPGATVKRGPDWMWNDQDGGAGSEGEVISYTNVSPMSSRDLIHVEWTCSFANSYRMGFEGKVDVICTEVEVGPFYYRDHLPSLDLSTLPYPLAPKDAYTSSPTTNQATTATANPTTSSPTSTPAPQTSKDDAATTADDTATTADSHPSSSSSTPQPGSMQPPAVTEASPPSAADSLGCGAMTLADQSGEEGGAGDDLCFVTGDFVVIGVNENKLRDLQEDFGGVSDSMIKMIRQKGTVTAVTTGIMVRFTSTPYRFNPLALLKVKPVKPGDVVRIRPDAELVKLLNKHIAWNQQIAEVCGTTGKVLSVDKDDTVTVNFGHYQTFRFSPACCIPSPGSTVDPVGAIGAARRGITAGGDTNATDGSAGATGSASGGGGGDKSAAAAVSQTNADTGAAVSAPPAANTNVAAAVPAFPNVGYDKIGKETETAKSDSDTDMGRAMLRMMGLLDSDESGGGSSSSPHLKILFGAIAQGEVNAVETLIRANSSLLHKTEQTLTPMMYACHKGQREVINKLLELGASVNEQGEKGRTPLLVALDSEKEDVALMLLDMGANPNMKNHRQRTPLHSAAYENLPNAVQMLICLGADVNAKDQVEDTPLFDAIEKGHAGIVEILLQAPNLNCQEMNSKGFNMLMLAALRGKAAIVEVILSSSQCPPVDAMLFGEYTALHIAANNNHVESVGILVLIGGATIDLGDGRRLLTPLHLACKRRHFQTAEALVGLGAMVNTTDVNGNTPLHLAMGKSLEGDNDDEDVSRETAIEQRTQIARLLISSGAIMDMKDDTGREPMSYGHREVQEKVAKFLLESFAGFSRQTQNPTPSNKSNPTPLPPSVSTPAGEAISSTTAWETASSATSVGTTPSSAQQESSGSSSKQFDTGHIHKLLQGVCVQCASCESMSDVTLLPCLHKSVCRKCCDTVEQCPTCGVEIEDKEPDNTDDQEEETEMNQIV